MLTVYSNEVDIEFSEENSENYTEPENDDDDDDDNDDDNDDNGDENDDNPIFSSSSDSSVSLKKISSSVRDNESYSYYDRKKSNTITSLENLKLDENDHFDPNNLNSFYKDIDYTGDKIDNSESTKSTVASQYAFEEALRINQLRKEIIFNSNPDYITSKLFIKNYSKSSDSSISKEKQNNLPSPKKYLTSHTVGQSHIKDYKSSARKNFSDMDSITLLIRVPRSKLINHIKNKSVIESWKTMSSKSSSIESLSNASVEKDSVTIQQNSDLTKIKNGKPEIVSESDITSIIDRSKEIIECCKESMKKSNKKLQTFVTNQSDKITQTLINQQENLFNSSFNHRNYFLCNICHKIVPANLSPVCMKLSCSAIKKCSLIFHGELDLIMHLPVKHSTEFASYHICSNCNRMYHPSNIVTIKGTFTCLDCVSKLIKTEK